MERMGMSKTSRYSAIAASASVAGILFAEAIIDMEDPKLKIPSRETADHNTPLPDQEITPTEAIDNVDTAYLEEDVQTPVVSEAQRSIHDQLDTLEDDLKSIEPGSTIPAWIGNAKCEENFVVIGSGFLEGEYADAEIFEESPLSQWTLILDDRTDTQKILFAHGEQPNHEIASITVNTEDEEAILMAKRIREICNQASEVISGL